MLRPVNSTGNCEPDQDSLLVKILENSAEKQRTSRRFAATDAARHASAIARKILGDGIDLCDPIHLDLDDQDRESNDSFFEDLPESLESLTRIFIYLPKVIFAQSANITSQNKKQRHSQKHNYLYLYSIHESSRMSFQPTNQHALTSLPC